MKRNHNVLTTALILSLFAGSAAFTPAAKAVAKDSEVEALEIQTDELSDQLSSLNNQVTKISNELDEISTDLDETNEAISLARIELVEAKEKVQDQYDAMKKRIRFMYENGSGESMLQMLLSSDSLADFVNRADFVSEVNGYDRDMLTELSETQEKIEEEEASLKKNKKKLKKLKAELTNKQEELSAKVAETSAALADSQEELAEAEAAALEREQSIRGAADGQSTASGSDSSSGSSSTGNSSIAGSTSDVAALAAIIECEAGGESYKGKVAVGAVVLNRVKSSKFPSTVMGVITQKNQFSPVASGRFAIVLARGARSDCVKAAKDALSGTDPTNGCLSFRATWSGNYKGLVIGNQVFF